MILIAVSQDRSIAATQPDISQIFYKMDTMIMNLCDPVASGQIEGLIADAKSFNLCVQTSNGAGLRKLLKTGKYKRFLGLMRNLELLSCSTFEFQNSPLPDPSISDIFGGNTWPHLRCLELGLFFVTANILSKLLSRHRSTLQKLTLQHILLSSGSWHDVFVKLREGALSTVEVHHLGKRDSPHEFFADIDELCLSPITSSHPLHLFLFQGASWVPDMDVVLEGIESDSEDMYSDTADWEAVDSGDDSE